MTYSMLRFFMLFATYLVAALSHAAPNTDHGFISEHASTSSTLFWDQVYPDPFPVQSLKMQQRITVKENRFVDEHGKTFRFIGMSVADPYKLDLEKQWQRGLFEEAKRWGANTIRLPIHPMAWRERGRDWYIERLDEAVRWANSLDLYLIIDWHSIGNLNTELFQRPMYETTWTETKQFWRFMALRYQKVPAIAVFELFNEPTDSYFGTGAGSLGEASWLQWRDKVETLIDLIYAYDDQIIPLVGGFNWAYDLRPIAEHPVRRPGVAYTSHPYPQKANPIPATEANYFKAWEEVWGFAAKQYPLILTEFGWMRENEYGAHPPVIDNSGEYGKRIVKYMDERGISYTVWIFNPDWPPSMIKNWDFEPTEQGAFFKRVMQAY